MISPAKSRASRASEGNTAAIVSPRTASAQPSRRPNGDRMRGSNVASFALIQSRSNCPPAFMQSLKCHSSRFAIGITALLPRREIRDQVSELLIGETIDQAFGHDRHLRCLNVLHVRREHLESISFFVDVLRF